ncbi:hypothetical protein C8J57DRAFT_1663986 [Mycena rebaudengoi]|nr:hypothetical protein C8J57DRAFT_1663986 [Mycena rebaudengoi]
MSGERRSLHRRRSSLSDDELVVVTPPADSDGPSPGPLPSPRSRVQSSPTGSRHQRNASISGLPLNVGLPPSAGPYRTTFPSSPLGRSTFAHSRNLSFSSPFSPPLPSPLSTSTSFADQISAAPMPTSPSAPEFTPESQKTGRRHSRLHSRNLSVFFPRPGTLPESTIDEDGAQEIIVPPTLGANFTFGGRPPSSGVLTPASGVLHTPPPLTPGSAASRRGHHHKHSMSHTLFSFLEPPQNQDLVTQPTPIPVSPWMPISPFVAEAKFDSEKKVAPVPEPPSDRRPAFLISCLQFLLGATLWVSGQQSGSLAVTALGYWVVFDSIGVAVPHIRLTASRPYGSKSVLLFAQSVYLMFSAVYVCKEAVEHLLLSAGEGHHHHAGDEMISVDGIDFPVFLTALTVVSLAATALLLDNHARLVSLAGNRIPPLSALVRSLLSTRNTPAPDAPTPTDPLARALSNPYASTPLGIGIGVLATALAAPRSQHRTADLALAAAASFATSAVAYRASAVLGAVLLQTAPPRGLPAGRMEAFLRAMREVERHPQVLHLPAPHIWQLTPGAAKEEKRHDAADGAGGKDALVVTLELHVRADMGDDDVLALTRWAWERCSAALGRAREETEVTVGVVRG